MSAYPQKDVAGNCGDGVTAPRPTAGKAVRSTRAAPRKSGIEAGVDVFPSIYSARGP